MSLTCDEIAAAVADGRQRRGDDVAALRASHARLSKALERVTEMYEALLGAHEFDADTPAMQIAKAALAAARQLEQGEGR